MFVYRDIRLVKRIKNERGRLVRHGNLFIECDVMCEGTPKYRLRYNCDARAHINYTEPQSNFEIVIR